MIILMGPSGSGKSTQAKKLADEQGYQWISTGEILRAQREGTKHQEMLQGKLISDQEMIDIIDGALSKTDLTKPLVLDGFPRTMLQANWLLDQVAQGRLSLDALIDLTATKELVHGRLLGRGRQDDQADIINRRFEQYHQVTLPILGHIKSKGIKVCDVAADDDPHIVHQAIMACLTK